MSGSRRKPGPLGPFGDGYRVWLLERGYSPPVAIRSLITLGHLGRWIEREALTVDQLTDERVTAFVADYRRDRGHLPPASVRPLLEYLRADGVVPPEPSGVVTPLERLVGEYRDWLLRERGLAPITVRASERLARRFLTERVSVENPSGAERITGAELNAFLLRECARVSVGSAACATYRLRSLLRYLAIRGFADPGLAEAVPRVARWREATIPKDPPRPDIKRLLESCDRAAAIGARDYAVLLLLARLGLRAIEVSRLRLEDSSPSASDLESSKSWVRSISVTVPLPSQRGHMPPVRVKVCLTVLPAPRSIVIAPLARTEGTLKENALGEPMCGCPSRLKRMRSIAPESVAVPTVERASAPIRCWSTMIAVVSPSSTSTSGRASVGMKPCTKAL